MTNREAIDQLRGMLVVNQKEQEAVDLACRALEEGWTPIYEDDPDSFPPVNEDGDSEWLLLSFANANFGCIGGYRVDEDGGAFFDGDDDEPLTAIGLIVNAWRKWPEPYREEEQER